MEAKGSAGAGFWLIINQFINHKNLVFTESHLVAIAYELALKKVKVVRLRRR
jgi:hypothetical protein